MGSHQLAMLSDLSVVTQPKSNSLAPKHGYSSSNGQRKEGIMGNSEGFIGVLEVFVHHARDIHNICIYHKQDVYAKIYFTSEPERSVSTGTINGGGQNPVFNENLKINVRNGDSSVRCEIWMLSRVRNYLEDQLLGFALVPLSEILIENVELEKEFELSTSDLFRSPSGFVKLSIRYTGLSPELLEIPAPPSCLANQDSEECDLVPCELEKIEFPDPKVLNENEIMVSEYFSAPCPELESQNLVSCQTTENDDRLSSSSNDHVVSKFAVENFETLVISNVEIPPSNDSKQLDEKKENVKQVEKKESVKQDETERVIDTLTQPVINIKVEQEQKVVQQEIVDMYMQSMKQFTEALAKMKLPLDTGDKSPDSRSNGSTESNGKGSKGVGPSPKVFYGSNAFF